MIHGRDSVANNRRRQVYVKHQLVFPGRIRVVRAKIHIKSVIAYDGNAGRHKVSVDIERLIVQIPKALEAELGGIRDGSIAGANVRVVSIPRRHFAGSQQSPCRL